MSVETTDTSKAPSYPITTLQDSGNTVDHPSWEYDNWMEDSKLPRTLYQGTKGMKDKSITYLPTNKAESSEAYAIRLENSVLLNAHRKTSAYLAGQVFQADVLFLENQVPSEILALNRNIDNEGNSINVFGKRVFQNGIAKGVGHIFIDSPIIPEGEILTQEDEAKLGIRPYFTEIKPENVIGWKIDPVTSKLIQVRIKEQVQVDSGQYSTKLSKRIRVLYPGNWELFEQTGESGYEMIESGNFSVPYIPFVSFIPGIEETQLTGETPLMDLAELNLAHWRSSSDQTNILHVGRVPLLFGRHIEVAAVPAGVASMLNSNDDSSDLKYVEISGAALGAGANDLKELEAKMALYGLQQLVPRTGSMTATEKALSSAESHSSLGTWAIEFESFLEQAYQMLGDFMGKEFPNDSIIVNREYNLGVADPQELAQILKANEQGIISAQGVFSEFRRRGTFDEHLTWEDMEADIEKEKQDNIEMAQLAGAAFGGDEEENEDDND